MVELSLMMVIHLNANNYIIVAFIAYKLPNQLLHRALNHRNRSLELRSGFYLNFELISKDITLMNTLPSASHTDTVSNVSQRLRSTMAALRLAFTCFGTRKTLNHEQKSQAADTLGAEREFLSAGKK